MNDIVEYPVPKAAKSLGHPYIVSNMKKEQIVIENVLKDECSTKELRMGERQ